MTDDDPLAKAIANWQRKYRIADDDPILAVLELVRLQLQHARVECDDAVTTPPSFDDFRSTIELLDRRSKSFINQAADLVTELRRFALNVARINRARLTTHLIMTAIGIVVGLLIGRCL